VAEIWLLLELGVFEPKKWRETRVVFIGASDRKAHGATPRT
jgi:hypothetical protein